ncbi:MAG: 8-amino-7-oxononanoate synthase [Alphaproteobacteria bacterium]|nr:MAG: 8-amino-7-oxononanoate synthase [Alphaproteobacteria bacterium]
MFDDHLQHIYDRATANSRIRTLTDFHSDGVHLWHEGVRYLSFASNDYLGIASSLARLADASLHGAGASRFVIGNHAAYAHTEALLAQIQHSEAALLFPSGYQAHLGVIPALLGKDDLIMMDKYAHACMVDGARLSGATVRRFRHNDLQHLSTLLAKHRSHARACMILTETVFSMDGDRAPLHALRALADSYDAWLMVDDAHGLGIPSSDSIVPIEVHTGTCSKSLGMIGGYVCGSRLLIDTLTQSARSLLFTTALPEAIVMRIAHGLDILMREPERGIKVMQLAQRFCAQCHLPVPSSPIIPIILGSNEHALSVHYALRELGMWVPAIRPPTVPEGTARLRISLSASHTEDQIDLLADYIARSDRLVKKPIG